MKLVIQGLKFHEEVHYVSLILSQFCGMFQVRYYHNQYFVVTKKKTHKTNLL